MNLEKRLIQNQVRKSK